MYYHSSVVNTEVEVVVFLPDFFLKLKDSFLCASAALSQDTAADLKGILLFLVVYRNHRYVSSVPVHCCLCH